MATSLSLVASTTFDSGLDAEGSTSGLGHILHAAEKLEERQAKMLRSLARQAELVAMQHSHSEERTVRRDERLHEIEEARAAELAQRKAHAAEMEAHRRARVEAAALAEEERRQGVQQKLQQLDERMERFETEKELATRHNAMRASRVAARREAAYRASSTMLEQRRSALEQRQSTAENLLHQREEIRQLGLQIKADEGFLRQQQREATKARAEKELTTKIAGYVERGKTKDHQLVERTKELEAVRKVKASEAQARSEYIALQARAAAEADAAERARLKARLDAKAERIEALAIQREMLMEGMTRLRHQMQQQEVAIRASLDSMRRSGAPFVLPPDVQRSLEVFGNGGFHLTAMATPRASRMLASAHRPRSAPRPRTANAATTSSMYSPRDSHSFALDESSAAWSPAGPGHKRMGGKAATPASPSGGAHDRKRVRPLSASAVLRSGGAGSGAAATKGKGKARGPKGPVYTTAGPTPGDLLSRREAELRDVLREEIDKEAERQSILAGAWDEREKARLVKIFSVEREDAKRRILELTAAVQAATPGAAALKTGPATARV